MSEKQLYAEIVKSGTWLYDGQVPHEVWIVGQNFDYFYEEGFEDNPESLNEHGEVFHVVIAFQGIVRSVVMAKVSLEDAVLDAENRLVEHLLVWDDHRLQKLFPPYYSLDSDGTATSSGEGVVFKTATD